MKITVIGGGGVRSMFLAKSLVGRAKELQIEKIVFMDNDPKKLNIYGKMAQQVAKRIEAEVDFSLTTDSVEAIKDTDYVITTMRVGGDAMRVQDERIALNHGVLGQETTGAAGFSFAMRSVPALAEYCELVKKYAAAGAKIFNFTNPAGVVSQTLRDMGYDFSFGICDAPSSLLCEFAKLYGVEQDRMIGECFGLNHLSFFNSIKLDGKEILPELIEDDRIYKETEMRFFDREMTKSIGCILNEYLYYFYYREKAVQNILEAGITRGEMIAQTNEEMTKELSEIDIENDFDSALEIFEKWYGKREDNYMANETGIKKIKPPYKFDIYSKDVGGYAGVALKYIETQQTGKEVQMVLCVPNDGAIKELEDGDTVEVTCTIKKEGYFPHQFENIDPVCMELVRRVKCYERLASKALRTKDRKTAIQCLMMHPLVNSYSLAKSIAEEYFIHNQAYFKGWK